MIDFDNSATFPQEIREWVLEQKEYFYSLFDKRDFSEWWQLEHKLCDIRLWEQSFIQRFVDENLKMEVAVWHTTRIEDKESYERNGIIIMGGRGSKAESNLICLFQRVGMNEKQIKEVFEHIYFLWDRDKNTRTHSVHFFVNRELVYNSGQMSAFALNLGGECVRWAIEAINRELYKIEPYKRLWIMGTPSIIKFKCKLEEIDRYTRDMLIAEIAKYYVVTELYGFPYEFEFTGRKEGKVKPEDIIVIEEIQGFIEMQEKYDDYQNFYNELKNKR